MGRSWGVCVCMGPGGHRVSSPPPPQRTPKLLNFPSYITLTTETLQLLLPHFPHEIYTPLKRWCVCVVCVCVCVCVGEWRIRIVALCNVLGRIKLSILEASGFLLFQINYASVSMCYRRVHCMCDKACFHPLAI